VFDGPEGGVLLMELRNFVGDVNLCDQASVI